MFSKILIANRGEIAVRIARTAKAMGVQTVAVCSAVDVNALHTHACDQSVMIGGASPAESYLNAQRIVEVALTTGAEAIHPGYGFLSENAEFAELCEAEGIKFIGPSSKVIRAMGLKSSAKTIVEKAGVPLLPGFHGEDQSDEVLVAEASRIGFPLLIKASAGGGGKGMRVVDRLGDFMTALTGARREAKNSFNNDHVLLERYIKAPRHIEVQIFADQQGNYVHLFERDCSLQRRYQKVIEEAPAPAISEELRRSLGETAITVAKAAGYEGAGTVEFIMDEKKNFYFMEMNTRLQVEHPVTEMITGQDLVEWQLRVAAGEALPKQQKDIKLKGHAVESRVYAENPARDFLPVSGRIEYLQERKGADADVRIDSGVQVGDEVGVYYDPMMSKIICWGETRQAALNKLNVALSAYQLAGIQTNINFLRALISVPDFSEAEQQPKNLNTGLINRYIKSLSKSQELISVTAVALFLAYELRGMFDGQLEPGPSSDLYSPWRHIDGWRLNRDASRVFRLICEDQTHEVLLSLCLNKTQFVFDGSEYELNSVGYNSDQIQVKVSGKSAEGFVFDGESGVTIFCEGQTTVISLSQLDLSVEEESGKLLIAPLPGYVRQILVAVGDSVQKEQALVIVEAMKMEHTILSPKSGTVVEIFYSEGDQVLEGVELLALEEDK
ncbi:MAG: acetyl/propionyl/methylcrotonyl-CoA carboxylase subunit alpha [Proteobacteria bacterium]|nr:acetyl/propionyl/methylcrotonyl-CoA carboxylase subunit alpha [Pseudomonadota bacterium]MDA1011256.1 acetyl/propionyl/methylcrotonyl-CoA carboxylase subunit alpha [Pseudomonadota bacterium]